MSGRSRLAIAAASGALVLTLVVLGAMKYRSGAGGREAPPSAGEHVHFVTFSPGSGERMYVGTHSGLSVVSLGGGEEFRRVAGRDVMNMAFDPGRPGRVVVGGHDLLSASDDGGRSWQAGAGLPPGPAYAVAAHPARPGEAYALAAGGWYVTRDGGGNWSPVR